MDDVAVDAGRVNRRGGANPCEEVEEGREDARDGLFPATPLGPALPLIACRTLSGMFRGVRAVGDAFGVASMAWPFLSRTYLVPHRSQILTLIPAAP